MRIDILTLFPEMFSALKCSILQRASDKGLLEINIVNIRDFSKDLHKKCDDVPYGGGAGMVMTVQPIYHAYLSIKSEECKTIIASPRGNIFNQKMAEKLSEKSHLIFICGHYEGIDERAITLTNAEEISVGDYVTTGGEIPVMAMIDCISRLVDGVINAKSLSEESISSGLLEYPQFTRPAEFMGLCVPDVLLSGHHKNIQTWRQEQSLCLTKSRRPDLLNK